MGGEGMLDLLQARRAEDARELGSATSPTGPHSQRRSAAPARSADSASLPAHS